MKREMPPCVVLVNHTVGELLYYHSIMTVTPLPSIFILSAKWTKTAMMELRSCRRSRF